MGDIQHNTLRVGFHARREDDPLRKGPLLGVNRTKSPRARIDEIDPIPDITSALGSQAATTRGP